MNVCFKNLSTIIVGVLIIFSVFFGAIKMVTASPARWVEVTRFMGPSSQETDYFTCGYGEWRLNWSYIPNPTYPQYAGFAFSAKDNMSQIVSSIYQSGNQTTSGLTYVHNEIGQFYLSITTVNLLNYTVIIEQDLDSIPEFPLGPVFVLLTATLFIAVLARKPS